MQINTLKNSFWLSSDAILKLISGLLVSIWMIKYLGAANFGKISYAIAINSIFSVVALLGLRDILIKEFVNENYSKETLIGTSAGLIFATSALLFLLNLLYFYLFKPTDTLTTQLVLITNLSLFFQFYFVYEYYQDAFLRAKNYILYKNIVTILSITLKIALLFFQAPLIAFAFPFFIDSLILFATYSFLLKKNIDIHQISFQFPLAKHLLRQTMPILLSALSVRIYIDIDQIMLKQIIGDEANGTYAFAVKLANILLFIPSLIINSSLPEILNAQKQSTELMLHKILKLFQIVCFIGYIIVLFWYLAADFLVPFIATPDFYVSIHYLKILTWTGIFSALGGARTLYLVSINQNRFYFLSVFFSCLLNIFLNLLFIPKYGAFAACYNTLITTFIAGIGFNFLFKPLRPIGILQLKSILYPKFW